MKREHRKQIKRDELVTGYERSAHWVKAHEREARATVIGVVVVGLLALAITTFQGRRNASAEKAFAEEGNDLEGLRGHVSDSGEGRWTIVDAIDHDVPTPVITASLYARFYSRGEGDYTHRVLAALRNQFGGHAVERSTGG